MTEAQEGREEGGHPPPSDGPVLVAALGASAGGLEALETFFDQMRPDTGVAFVVIQHLDPNRESIGPELLSGHTDMPVDQAEEGDVLQPDRVYVTPPNAWMTVREGRLHLDPPEAGGAPTVIDRFFRSLADDLGSRAVAIVLSGAGSDGAAGIGYVREAGGVTMVQDPATARFDSMPRHAITTDQTIDILPPAGLAARLAEYAGGTGQDGDPVESEEVPEGLVELLKRETGHDFAAYKPATILRRLERRVRLMSCAGLDEYLDLLREDPDEIRDLYQDLLIGVTRFFRDPEAFRALQERVTSLLASREESGEAVRIWIPGCGTGQEVYSVAIVFHEAMASLPRETPLKIFATDVSEDALAVARRGCYPQGIAEELPDELLGRYFHREKDELRVLNAIRDQCIFARHDLLADPPFSDLDLISCRNVLIYLGLEAQERVLHLFHYGLRPGGLLFLGASERVTGHEKLFRTMEGTHRIFQRRETAAHVPGRFLAARGPEGRGSAAAARAFHSDATGGGRRAGRPVAGPVEGLERVLLSDYTPPCVIVDDEREIVYYHGRTGAYLEPASGSPSNSLLDMARPGLRHDLRGAIAEAEREGEAAVRESVMVETAEGWKAVDLTVRPLSRGEGDAGFHLVLFEESPEREPRPEARPGDAAAEEVEGKKAPQDRIIEELEEELADTKEQLRATIGEIESTNEELRAANEELVSMNEELQSSNEELQTSQEETESVNEELQTVNTELSQKIEQLKEAHADLDNLFRSTDIATIFLDRDLRIKRFTPPATDLFRLQEEDAGRSIEDITSRIVENGQHLAEELRGVLKTLEPVERELQAGEDDGWYVMRIFPYRTVEDVIDGVVLTFVEITDMKRLEHERSQLAAIVEGMHDAVVGHRPDGTITSWNEGAERLFGYDAEEAIGRDMSLIMPAEHDGELESSVEQVLRGEWTKAEETVRTTRDGERLHVSVNLSPVRDETGRVVEISQTARDITGRIMAERAVREGEQRKDEFLAMLGHELRNPLGVIRNGIDLLKQGRAPGAEAGDADPIEILERQVHYLIDLVDDFTEVTRLTTGHFDLRLETMDLAELVRKSVADHGGHAKEAGVALETDVQGRRLVVEGDRTRLAQVLGNLIRNACSYTPEGGHVLVTAREDQGSAVVSVQDDGPGLEAEELERVFELFQRGPDALSADGDGLGLGLPVSRKLMALHGGSLDAASEGEGRGATFIVRVPLIDEGEPERGASLTETAGGPEGAPARRVLVVEDDRDAAFIFEQVLRVQGHEVTVAYDAASALDAVQEARPDVVLCDINLRGEVDGYELASALREIPELAGLRLVAVTGYGRETDRTRALEAGFDAHLTKPVGADDLNRVLAD